MLFLFFLSVNANQSYDDGKAAYMQKGCNGCHGNRAEGLNEYPALANRDKKYMTYKLKRFRSKKSDNQQQEMMVPFAVNLSNKDIDNLTTFMRDFKEKKISKKYNDSFIRSGDGGS
ncbi:c-type cytochrome [Sulfurimonas sp.]|uniref:c-type cytochrome n=1 Tax=Sulfurimonas sp. TaxID=2022749 RepID=UPI0025F8290C|nr:c-type cytochrome [Sulfurimonas sp.]